MKKLLTPLFALAALAMTNTSCSDDLENGASGNGNEATVSFNVQLENAVGSRAVGDGTTAKELHYAVYKVDAEGKTIGDEIEALRGTKNMTDLKAEVTLTLVKGQTYNFLFWAQNESSTHYDLDYETGFITVKYADNEATTDVVEHETMANNEERDAFFKVRKDLKVTGPINETITLKRPFAQVNVGTSVGSLADAAKAEVNVTKSSFVVKNAATKLDTYTGAATEAVEVTYTRNNISLLEQDFTDEVGDLKNVVINNEENSYEYLAMNYILVADERDDKTDDEYGVGENKQLVDAEFEIFDESGNSINKFDIPNVPVQRNWRTNIIGDIMNESVTFNIVIDPKFDNDHNYITNEELYYAAQNGGEVTLKEPLVVNSAEEALVIKKGATVVLNLNGQGIKTNVAKVDAIVVEEGAELTINGDESAVIEAISGGNGFAMVVKGKVTINGGYYKSGKDENNETNACVYATGNGQIYVNGGKFESADGTFVLNKYDSDRKTTVIEVRGGTFVNFNPADNASEGAGTNFVANGYKAVNVGTDEAPIYQVVVETTADADGNVTLSGNGSIVSGITMAGGTLNGNGYTLTLESEPTTNSLIAGTTGNNTIKNVTIEGGNTLSADLDKDGAKKSTRALYFTGSLGDLTISNVDVSGVGYALNVNTSNKATGALTVTDSSLEGWTSFSGVFTSVTFKNVHFGIGNYFAGTEYDECYNGGIRPFQSTTLENCTFDQNFYLCLTKLGEGAITLKNCKVGEVTLTSSNYTQYLKIEGTATDSNLKFEE